MPVPRNAMISGLSENLLHKSFSSSKTNDTWILTNKFWKFIKKFAFPHFPDIRLCFCGNQIVAYCPTLTPTPKRNFSVRKKAFRKTPETKSLYAQTIVSDSEKKFLKIFPKWHRTIWNRKTVLCHIIRFRNIKNPKIQAHLRGNFWFGRVSLNVALLLGSDSLFTRKGVPIRFRWVPLSISLDVEKCSGRKRNLKLNKTWAIFVGGRYLRCNWYLSIEPAFLCCLVISVVPILMFSKLPEMTQSLYLKQLRLTSLVSMLMIYQLQFHFLITLYF